MAHIKCRYYKPRCKMNNHQECNFDYDNCRCEGDRDDCEFINYQYTEFEKTVKTYELYGEERLCAGLDDKSIIYDPALWLGKTCIDNIVYLEIDGRIITDNSVGDDGTHLTTEFLTVDGDVIEVI